MPEIINNACLSGRPGGFILTDRAMELGGFSRGDKILDLGCGSGATVEYLRSNYLLEASGLDKNPALSSETLSIIKSSAEKTPAPDSTFDGILMECSFSLMDKPAKVLDECDRVLKPDGKLMVSDIYARGAPANLQGCLGRIDSRENIIKLFEEHRFKVLLFEDHTRLLQSMWGQMIFEQGAREFYGKLGAGPDEFRKIRCGYYLMLAVKTDPNIL